MTNDHRPIDRLDDEALFAALRAGSPRAHDAFGMLLFRHEGAIRGIVRNKLRGLPDHDIEEVHQEVFLALHQAALDGKEVGKVRPWLNRVARNKAADYFRGRAFREFDTARHGVARDDDRAGRPAAEIEDSAAQDALEVELVFAQVLALRPPAHRAIIEGYVVRGGSAKTVAAATGETADNVYKVAQRFRDDLRAALNGDAPPTQTDHRT